MQLDEKIILFFITTLLLISISNVFAYNPYSVATANSYNNKLTAPSYYIFYTNTTAYTTAYLLDNNYKVINLPLYKILPSTCPIINKLFPNANYIITNIGSVYLNITLPNGTHINNMIYSIAEYLGCGTGKPRIAGITVDLKKKIITIHVFVPINGKGYNIPAVFTSDKTLLIYKYVNTTYFEVDLKLYNLTDQYSFGVQNIKTRSFNITYRFLVNENTWMSYYWNGHKWINIGMLPFATPAIDARYLLFKLYQNYANSIKYYMTHKLELNTIIEKIQHLLKTNQRKKAYALIDKIAGTPMPQLLVGESEAVYWGKPIKYDTSNVIGPRLIFTIPPYTDINIIENDNAIDKIYDQLVEGIKQYLLTHNYSLLQQIIDRSNGFVKFGAEKYNGQQAEEYWVCLYYMPLLYIMPTLITLPSNPGFASQGINGVKYVFLDMETQSNGTQSIIRKTISSEPSLSVIRNIIHRNSFGAVIIDRRLAAEWLLLSNRSIDWDSRIAIFYNVGSAIFNAYVNTIVNIVSGVNPDTEFENLLSYVKSVVIHAAYSLGGSIGEKVMEKTISLGKLELPPGYIESILPPISTSTTNTHKTLSPETITPNNSSRTTSSTSPTTSIENNENRTNTNSGNSKSSSNSINTSALVAAVIVIIALVVTVLYYLLSRSRGKS